MDQNAHRPTRNPAVLLLGPTGAGKTPLGELVENRGLRGDRFVHFDFGAQLRRLVDEDRPDERIGRRDLDFLRGVLRSGALLENEQFPLAARILASFLARRGVGPETVVVLNGLPRHAGQAEALQRYVDVRLVVHLACSEDAVLARIEANVGGDRARREDDDPESVRRKVALFRQRTAPLLDYYRGRGVHVETIEVTAAMTPEDVWRTLAARGPWGPDRPARDEPADATDG